MTVKNTEITNQGSQVTVTWEMTEDYAFVYADAEVIARLPMSVTTWTGRIANGAVVQVVDSSTATPDPAATDPQPQRYVEVIWYPVDDLDIVAYHLYMNGVLQTTRDIGQTSYTFKTGRLLSGDYTFEAKAEDTSGNLSTVSTLPITIDEVPPPTLGLTLTQTVPGSGDINLQFTPPATW